MNPSIFLPCRAETEALEKWKKMTSPNAVILPFLNAPFFWVCSENLQKQPPLKTGWKTWCVTWIQVWPGHDLIDWPSPFPPGSLNLWAFRYRHIGIPQQMLTVCQKSSVVWWRWRLGVGKKILKQPKNHTETEKFLTSWKNSNNKSQKSLSPPTNRRYFVDILCINLLAKIPKLWVWGNPMLGAQRKAISIITTCIWWCCP